MRFNEEVPLVAPRSHNVGSLSPLGLARSHSAATHANIGAMSPYGTGGFSAATHANIGEAAWTTQWKMLPMKIRQYWHKKRFGSEAGPGWRPSGSWDQYTAGMWNFLPRPVHKAYSGWVLGGGKSAFPSVRYSPTPAATFADPTRTPDTGPPEVTVQLPAPASPQPTVSPGPDPVPAASTPASGSDAVSQGGGQTTIYAAAQPDAGGGGGGGMSYAMLALAAAGVYFAWRGQKKGRRR